MNELNSGHDSVIVAKKIGKFKHHISIHPVFFSLWLLVQMISYHRTLLPLLLYVFIPAATINAKHVAICVDAVKSWLDIVTCKTVVTLNWVFKSSTSIFSDTYFGFGPSQSWQWIHIATNFRDAFKAAVLCWKTLNLPVEGSNAVK